MPGLNTITPKFTVSGGLRYTDTKQSQINCTRGDAVAAGFFGFVANLFRQGAGAGPTNAYVAGGCITIGPAPTFLPFQANYTQQYDNVSWRVGANYKPSRDSIIYASISRGYKAGGFAVSNAVTVEGTARVAPEQITAYEIGARASFGRSLDVSAAAFYYDYLDKQLFYYLETPGFGVVTTLGNVPKSSARGFEVEATLRPVDGLKLHAALTYNKTKVGDFTAGRLISSNNGAAVYSPGNVRGKSFNYAPEWSGTFDAEYKVPVSNSLDVVVGASALYNSQTFGDLANSSILKIDAYTIFDTRIGIESDSGWRVTAWVRNLTDKYYWTNMIVGADTLNRYAGMPRTYGITVGYRF